MQKGLNSDAQLFITAKNIRDGELKDLALLEQVLIVLGGKSKDTKEVLNALENISGSLGWFDGFSETFFFLIEFAKFVKLTNIHGNDKIGDISDKLLKSLCKKDIPISEGKR